MKKAFSFILIAILAFSLVACGETEPGTDAPTLQLSREALAVLSDLDKDITVSPDAVTITLSDGASTATANNVKIEGDKITVQSGGTFLVSGSLSDGQLIVEADKLHKVHLIFNGVSISNDGAAPFYVKSADKVVVTLTENSVNTFSDIMRPPASGGEDEEADSANACIYAADDLTFNGFGTLKVESSYNGISGKNDIRICGGTYAVNAGNNGIKGKDSLVLALGTVSVTAGKDGIKSDNIDETGRGYIHCCGATVSVQSGDDGIQAVTQLKIDAGSVTVNAGDNAINCDGEINIKDGCYIDVNAD